MKKYAETIVTVIITFTVSLLLNTSLNFLTRDHGAIKFGSMTRVGGQNYLFVDVENFENKPTNGLLLAIPADITKNDLISSHPVDINEIPANTGTSQIKYLEISGIEPRATVELLIPIEDQEQKNLIRFTNLEDLGYTSSSKGGAKSPFQLVLQESIRIAIINSVIYGAAVFWMAAQAEKGQNVLKENQKTLKEQIEKLEDRLSQDKKETKEERKEMQKIRLLLLARLSDYQKELNFWRDTIRKLLYEGKASHETADTLFDQVTKALKTYSVKEKGVDFDAIDTLAKLLNNESNNS